jgi:hypothetical protein
MMPALLMSTYKGTTNTTGGTIWNMRIPDAKNPLPGILSRTRAKAHIDPIANAIITVSKETMTELTK